MPVGSGQHGESVDTKHLQWLYNCMPTCLIQIVDVVFQNIVAKSTLGAQ